MMLSTVGWRLWFGDPAGAILLGRCCLEESGQAISTGKAITSSM
jgi:hypothetical protein